MTFSADIIFLYGVIFAYFASGTVKNVLMIAVYWYEALAARRRAQAQKYGTQP